MHPRPGIDDWPEPIDGGEELAAVEIAGVAGLHRIEDARRGIDVADLEEAVESSHRLASCDEQRRDEQRRLAI